MLIQKITQSESHYIYNNGELSNLGKASQKSINFKVDTVKLLLESNIIEERNVGNLYAYVLKKNVNLILSDLFKEIFDVKEESGLLFIYFHPTINDEKYVKPQLKLLNSRAKYYQEQCKFQDVISDFLDLSQSEIIKGFEWVEKLINNSIIDLRVEIIILDEQTVRIDVDPSITLVNLYCQQNSIPEHDVDKCLSFYNVLVNNSILLKSPEQVKDELFGEKKVELTQLDLMNHINLEKKAYKCCNSQLIIDGAPGTGKSYHVNNDILADSKLYERVTFYSDYEYHNFIGSILPKLNGETVTYEFVKGPFTKILNDALSQPEDKHYLIVEELTRGNAAAIFGDILQLLDRDEEGWSEYPITHNNILESLDPEVRTFLENEYEGKVVLPPNLSIICTINSSDQNVYPLDTAFKRRFDYKIESTNVHSEFVDYDIKFGTDITVSWLDFYQKLNKYILVDLGLKEDKQVGPYFIKNHKDDNKKLESIQTKLAMYMWNDLHKVHTISNKTIFKDVHTLYEVDNLFRTGSREQILNILSEEFKQHFNLKDSSEITE